MRLILLALLPVAAAVPAAAQPPASPGGKVAAIAPALDRATGIMLDLDVGPIIDAADPYGRGRYQRRHRTLRDIARRDDPYFEQRLRGQIYGTTAAMARMIDAFAAAEPALRRSVRDMEREIDLAVRDARGPPPPPEVDDDWDLERDEDESYDD
jgi:hypothetical protein